MALPLEKQAEVSGECAAAVGGQEGDWLGSVRYQDAGTQPSSFGSRQTKRACRRRGLSLPRTLPRPLLLLTTMLLLLLPLTMLMMLTVLLLLRTLLLLPLCSAHRHF